MSIHKQVRTGVKWTTLSTIVLAVTAILKISILTRYLDKVDFGLMALITFILGFMDLFNDMGISSAILHKQKISKQEYASLYWFNILFSLFLFILLFLIAPIVASYYEQPMLRSLIPLLGLNIIFSGIGRQFKVREQKELSFQIIGIIDIVSALLSLIAAVYLAMKGYGIYSLIYSVLLQSGFANIWLLTRGLRKEKLLIRLNFGETRPFLKIGMYQVGGQVVNYFNRDFDILMIGKLFSPDILGGYSLAKQLVMRPMQVLNPIISTVASPTLAKFQHNKMELKKHYLKLINIISTINIPAYFILIIFAPSIIELLYGKGFDEIVILVRILSLYMIIRTVNSPVGSLVIATGRTDIEFYWNVFSLLITPVFIYVGSLYGVVGATVGITLSMAVLFIPAWKLMVFRMTGANLTEYLYSLLKLDFKIFRGIIKK